MNNFFGKPKFDYMMSSENAETSIPVKIVFYSTLQKIAQTKEAEFHCDPNTGLEDLLTSIQQEYFIPHNGRILKADNQSLDVGMICLLDDVDMHLMGGMRYKITKPTTITLISSLHGG